MAAGVRLCVHCASAVTPEWGFSQHASTFRPNPIGHVAGRAGEVVCHKDSVILKLGSLDLVDGTPVVISNRISPLGESLPDASASWRKVRQLQMAVGVYQQRPKSSFWTLEKRYPQLTLFIREVTEAQDPRPAYRKGEET